MSHARNRLRTLGLGLIAVLGLAAMMAGGAQAASWKVGGSTLGNLHASVDADPHLNTLLLLLVPTLAGGFEVDCKQVDIKEGVLLGATLTEPGVGHGVFNFRECKTYIAGVHNEPCDPVGNLFEVKFLVKPVTHNGATKLLFTPPTGTTQFALINIGEECALPVKNELKGKLLASCLNKGTLVLLDCLHEQNGQPLKQLAALSHALSYGLHAASLDGVVEVFEVNGAKLAAHG